MAIRNHRGAHNTEFSEVRINKPRNIKFHFCNFTGYLKTEINLTIARSAQIAV